MICYIWRVRGDTREMGYPCPLYGGADIPIHQTHAPLISAQFLISSGILSEVLLPRIRAIIPQFSLFRSCNGGPGVGDTGLTGVDWPVFHQEDGQRLFLLKYLCHFSLLLIVCGITKLLQLFTR